MQALSTRARPLPADDTAAVSSGQRQLQRLLPELLLLAIASVVCAALFSSGEYAVVTVLAPLVLLLVNAIANYLMIVDDSAMLLTPLFGARLSAMVVFGLGGLFDALAPANIQTSNDYLYVTSLEEAAKVNLLWLSGMTFLIAGCALAMRLRRSFEGTDPPSASSRVIPLKIGLWMFIVSGSINIVLLDMATFGVLFTIPAIVGSLLLAFQLFGIFVIAERAGSSAVALVTMFLALFVLMATALVFQNKSFILYPALIAMLGFLSRRVTWPRALASAFAVFLLFVIIAPVVGYARERQVSDHGTLEGGTLAGRMQYVMDFLGGDRITNDDESVTLNRLDYVVPASFVMARFEQGLPSDRLVTSPYMFIPRAIWRDKPLTSTSALEVNNLLGSQSTNQIGVTIFADLYWNVGWLSLALATVMGIYFGLISSICRSIRVRGQWMLVPFALASLRLGMNLDSDFASGFMVPAVMNLLLLMLLRFASRMIPDSVNPSDRPRLLVA